MMAAGQGKDAKGGVYATSMEFVRAVHRLWPLGFDLAANIENNVCRRLGFGGWPDYFYSENDDAIKQDWHKLPNHFSWLWLNPPFAHIEPWAKKCAEESVKGARILLLVPQGSQDWNAKWCQGRALELRLQGRLKFEGEKDLYPKDLSLFVFGAGIVGTGFWDWRKS